MINWLIINLFKIVIKNPLKYNKKNSEKSKDNKINKKTRNESQMEVDIQLKVIKNTWFILFLFFEKMALNLFIFISIVWALLFKVRFIIKIK